jgi:pimeloyl-ACP methyl ester carboxylesterase
MSVGETAGDDTEPESVRLLDKGTVDELFAGLAVEALAPAASPELVTTVRRLTNSHGAEVVRGTLIAATRADASDWIPGVGCPVLVLTGEHDAACPPEEGSQLAASVRGSHETLAAVGHLPMIEGAAAVAKLLVPHLDAAEVKAELSTTPEAGTP